jgi:hypothetical protein
MGSVMGLGDGAGDELGWSGDVAEVMGWARVAR